MEKLFKVDRLTGHWPNWLSEEIEKSIKQEIIGTALVKKILDIHGIAIRTKNILRQSRKWKNLTSSA